MSDILVHTESGVTTISFNRLERKNSITAAMYASMADALAAATGGQGKTRQGCRTGRCFAISFGDDFVAHLVFQEK